MSLKILFVDDESDLCEIFKDYFSSNEIDINVINDPIKSIELCKKKKFDLIFIDYRMPLLRGDELAVKLPSGIPIYLVTGESNPNFSFKFTGVLKKPFNYAEIQNIISKHHNH